MTFAEIKEQVMFQTNNDADDLEDFLPHVDDYVNEGYDRLVNAWAKNHIPMTERPTLKEDSDIPALPFWTHRALADYATWLVYRNGNPQKQQRCSANEHRPEKDPRQDGPQLTALHGRPSSPRSCHRTGSQRPRRS